MEYLIYNPTTDISVVKECTIIKQASTIQQRLCRKYNYAGSCKKCLYKIRSKEFLSIVTFRELVGALAILMRQVNNVNITPDLTECMSNCAGEMLLVLQNTDKEYKLENDKNYCHTTILLWKIHNYISEDNELYNKIGYLNNVIDESTTLYGIVYTLDSFFEYYDNWSPMQ